MKPTRLNCVGTIAFGLLFVVGCERAPNAFARSDSSRASSVKISVPATLAQGSFAFADSTGYQLLAIDSVAAPLQIHGSICSGGIALAVRYDRTQARRAGDNGRQISSNFDNQKGAVFRVIENNAPIDKSCYLSPDSSLLSSAGAVYMQDPADCGPPQAARVEAAKHRQVIHCWKIGAAPAQREVLAVQFADVDSNALASLVVVGDSSLLFEDFPAVHNTLEGSTWRVDDGGVFSPENFDILFVAAMPYGYVMAVAWAGAEGESSDLLVANAAGAFRSVAKGYRYWSSQ